jgi:hypothetical protein
VLATGESVSENEASKSYQLLLLFVALNQVRSKQRNQVNITNGSDIKHDYDSVARDSFAEARCLALETD